MASYRALLLLAALAACLAALPARAQNTTNGAAPNGQQQAPAGLPPPGANDLPAGFENVEGFFVSSPPAESKPAFGQAAGNVTRLKYTGTGTRAYGEEALASTGAVNFACSFGFVSPAFRANYVGLSSTFYNKGFGCGQCVKLQCDDQACAQLGRQVLAMVVDLCGDCFDADLSIAGPTFQNLTGAAGPAAQVSWEWASCGDLIEGNIMMLVKPGGTVYFQAVNFANSKQPIVAVQINRQLLKHSQSGNWWEWNPGTAIDPNQRFEIRLLGNNKQVLTVVLPRLGSANLGVQFKDS